jgi:hypothetical protein
MLLQGGGRSDFVLFPNSATGRQVLVSVGLNEAVY